MGGRRENGLSLAKLRRTPTAEKLTKLIQGSRGKSISRTFHQINRINHQEKAKRIPQPTAAFGVQGETITAASLSTVYLNLTRHLF